MLIIRLARIGKKNKPLYRLVISQKQKDLYGTSLEILGSYNPHAKTLKANNEKIKYWLSRGAGMSPTVNNLLIEKKIIEGKKVKATRNRKPKEAAAETKPASPAGGPAEAKAESAKPEAEKTEAKKAEAAAK
ncbi:MAG: 30S ribosomal protein S16 [Patescibacteria group bacterium]|nr:30S ribosomal protein S16 [Patescibacteria group bacterium]